MMSWVSGAGQGLQQLRSRREEFTRVAERVKAGADVLPYKIGQGEINE